LTFAPLVILVFVIGIYPKPFFEILEQPVNQLVLSVRPNYPGLGGNVNASARQAKGLAAGSQDSAGDIQVTPNAKGGK
jgi:hypothetical protein